MKMKNISKENGIGLVEVIFALGISVVIITSLVSLSLFTLRSSLQSKLMLQGTKLLTQELEMVRAYRDKESTTWENFLTNVRGCSGSNRCSVPADFSVITAAEKILTVDGADVTIYFQAHQIDASGNALPIGPSASPDFVRISGTASWVIGSQTKYVHNYTDLSNWRGK